MTPITTPYLNERIGAVALQIDLEVMIKSMLQDLEAIKGRLHNAPEWVNSGERAISAAALAEEIRALCEQASSSSDVRQAKSSIREAEKLLQKLNALLGVH